MDKKVYYITIDNLDSKHIGCFGGGIETKFIDMLSCDGFRLNKHFMSADENFYSVMSGIVEPYLEDDGSLTSLMNGDFAGFYLGYPEQVKKMKKSGLPLDFYSHPVDLATSALKYIKNKNVGFLYIHYALINKPSDDYGYAEQVVKTDAAIGKLLAAIDEFGEYNDAYIILTGSGSPTAPCILKTPEYKMKSLYSCLKKVDFVTRDIDIIPTIFDMEDEYQRLPEIDGTSIVYNLQGKDQKLSVFKADKSIFNHKGEKICVV